MNRMEIASVDCRYSFVSTGGIVYMGADLFWPYRPDMGVSRIAHISG